MDASHTRLSLSALLIMCLLGSGSPFLPEPPTLELRVYDGAATSGLKRCCSAAEEQLASCLRDASRPQIEEADQCSSIGLFMMTSPQLGTAYAWHAEAAVALWSARQGRTFVVVEIDDGGDGGGSEDEGTRSPHWHKVPLILDLLQRHFEKLLYLDADCTMVDPGSCGVGYGLGKSY